MATVCVVRIGHKVEKTGGLTADTQAVPLLASGRSCLGGRNIKVGIGMNNILLRFLGFFLNVHNHGLLLHYNLVEVLEQLGQFGHGALNLLNGIVTLADICQSALGLASAIRVKERLLEDLSVGAGLGGLENLFFGGLGVHDEILATLLLLYVLAELRFDGLIMVDCFADTTVQSVYLGFIAWVSRL